MDCSLEFSKLFFAPIVTNEENPLRILFRRRNFLSLLFFQNLVFKIYRLKMSFEYNERTNERKKLFQPNPNLKLSAGVTLNLNKTMNSIHRMTVRRLTIHRTSTHRHSPTLTDTHLMIDQKSKFKI